MDDLADLNWSYMVSGELAFGGSINMNKRTFDPRHLPVTTYLVTVVTADWHLVMGFACTDPHASRANELEYKKLRTRAFGMESQFYSMTVRPAAPFPESPKVIIGQTWGLIWSCLVRRPGLRGGPTWVTTWTAFILPSLKVNSPAPLDKTLKLTKKEREEAESTLVRFGNTVYRAEHKLPVNRSRPKSAYFPSSILSSLLDNLLSLNSLAKLEGLVEPWYFSRDYRVRLYAVVHDLFSSISAQRERARLDKNAKQRATRKAKKKATDWDGSEEEESESESSSEDEVDEDRRSSPIPPAPKRSRRVLEEVTNASRSPPARALRKPAQRAVGKPVQRAPRKRLEKAIELAPSMGIHKTSSLWIPLARCKFSDRERRSSNAWRWQQKIIPEILHGFNVVLMQPFNDIVKVGHGYAGSPASLYPGYGGYGCGLQES
ncbi:hypothetical protein B0H14DRAFT_2563954 [Mycena olivaceomarginata]|nr:hypothetical protein B0H14DRAFT_2563954 [Mycena olivaceomarginata]